MSRQEKCGFTEKYCLTCNLTQEANCEKFNCKPFAEDIPNSGYWIGCDRLQCAVGADYLGLLGITCLAGLVIRRGGVAKTDCEQVPKHGRPGQRNNRNTHPKLPFRVFSVS